MTSSDSDVCYVCLEGGYVTNPCDCLKVHAACHERMVESMGLTNCRICGIEYPGGNTATDIAVNIDGVDGEIDTPQSFPNDWSGAICLFVA